MLNAAVRSALRGGFRLDSIDESLKVQGDVAKSWRDVPNIRMRLEAIRDAIERTDSHSGVYDRPVQLFRRGHMKHYWRRSA